MHLAAHLAAAHRGGEHRGRLRHRRVLRARPTTRPRPCRRRHAHLGHGQRASLRRPTPARPRDPRHRSPPPQPSSSLHWPAGPSRPPPREPRWRCWSVWLLLYLRVSAPINRALTAAADNHETPANARALQHDWDRVIVPRAMLQGLAVAALCVNLIN